MTGKKNIKQIIVTVSRRLLLIILGLLLGISVYLANARSLIRNDLPMPFGTGIAVVLSGSMEPKLQVGDLIIVREVESYSVGDIVVYRAPRELIVHRIVEIDGDSIITQGDANNSPDEAIDKSDIFGVVVSNIPLLGSVINAIRTPIGIVVLLVLSFALIELSFNKHKKNDDKNIEELRQEIQRLKDQQYKK